MQKCRLRSRSGNMRRLVLSKRRPLNLYKTKTRNSGSESASRGWKPHIRTEAPTAAPRPQVNTGSNFQAATRQHSEPEIVLGELYRRCSRESKHCFIGRAAGRGGVEPRFGHSLSRFGEAESSPRSALSRLIDPIPDLAVVEYRISGKKFMKPISPL